MNTTDLKMKSHHAVPLLASVLVLCALSNSGCKRKTEGPTVSDDDGSFTTSPREPIDTTTTGSVSGIVKLDGTPRKMRVINMAAVPNCAKMHSSPAMTEDVVAGANGTLQNVVVYLKGNFNRYAFDPAKSPVMMDQKGCTYSPHVLALMTGQPLQIANSDQASHNVNAAPKLNARWNESQAAGAAPITQVFAHSEIGIPVKCNVHPWMKSYISVFSNPYFQVTSEDGSFKIDNVPPGTYTLTAWHELYGTKEQIVTIKTTEAQTALITFTDRDRR
jgi:plastocyanin